MSILAALILVSAIVVIILLSGAFHKINNISDELNPDTTICEEGVGYTYYRDYGGEIRYVNGMPLKTTDDLVEWQTIMAHGKNMYGRMLKYEDIITGSSEEEAAKALISWESLFIDYRSYVLKHGLYNELIGDRKPYKGTADQLCIEDSVRTHIGLLYQESKIKRQIILEAKNQILTYTHDHKGEDRRKSTLIRTVYPTVGDDKRNLYQRAYKELLADGVIREIIRQNGTRYIQLCSKKKGNFSKKFNNTLEISLDTFSKLIQSQLNPELYANLDFKTICKARYDVGAPRDLDRNRNNCTFISESTGEPYTTSLEACTCPAFQNGINPCKHMVKLKIVLFGE